MQALLKVEQPQGKALSEAEQEKERELGNHVLQGALILLEDPESRVRLAVGEYLGLLAQNHGIAVWEEARDSVLGSIEHSWVSSASS